jgi:serine/threonine protein kinase
MVGKTISHYKITEKLGEGGMGEVYLADDLKLDRQIAIKFLPEHLTKDKENVERFEREAKAAAALNHPNIVTIHEIAEHDGQTFIVMEYVDGDSLRIKIDDKNLDVEEVINITNQICEGLSEAHKADIVHRDIKPENILIDNRGRVKILDFGLAKLKGVSKLTKETSTLGTVHYMSPEQIQGKEVDNRSDIWSVGIVIYELLIGEVPFQGNYEQAVTYAILNEEPRLLKDIKSKYFFDIEKLLAKEPNNRFQNCEEVLIELEKIKQVTHKKGKFESKRAFMFSGIAVIIALILFSVLFFLPTEKDEKSIISLAVLPFTNIKPDPNIDYLGNAFAAEIINDLSYFKNISVRPFSTVRDLENWDKLDVDYILTGNFLQVMGDIRLKIELFNNNTKDILWQESLEEEFKKSYILQDIVSEKVINELEIRFSSEESHRMQIDIPKNPIAYEYYLRGVAYPLSVEGSHLSISMLTKSINLDSTYAPAFAELGYRKQHLAQYELESSNLYNEAEKYYEKSLNINPELLNALTNLAGLYVELGKSGEALLLSQKAIKINPNYAVTHFRLSYIYRYTGMLNESKEEAEKALALDPTNARFRSIGRTYLYLGEYKKALIALELGGQSAFTYVGKGGIYFREGKLDSALGYFNRAINIESSTFSGIISKAIKEYIEQNKVEGLEIIKQWEKGDPRDSEVLYTIAAIYGLFGEKKRCSHILRKAVEGGFFNYPFMLNDTFFDPVRDDPEFKEVLILAKDKHEAFKRKYFPEEL